MMYHWTDGWGLGGWMLMGFGTLLFWALIVAGIVWLVRYASSNRSAVDSPDTRPGDQVSSPRSRAREILDELYARGEISDEEYRTRRDTLTSR